MATVIPNTTDGTVFQGRYFWGENANLYDRTIYRKLGASPQLFAWTSTGPNGKTSVGRGPYDFVPTYPDINLPPMTSVGPENCCAADIGNGCGGSGATGTTGCGATGCEATRYGYVKPGQTEEDIANSTLCGTCAR
jgi:hypothetical protein